MTAADLRAEAHALRWGPYLEARTRGDHDEAERIARRADALDRHADLEDAKAWTPPTTPDQRLSADDRAELQRIFDRRIAERRREELRHQARARDRSDADKLVSAAYGQAVLEGECTRVANTPKGNRYKTLKSASVKVGQRVGAHLIDENEAHTRLLDAARDCGLTEAEAEPVIEWGLDFGARNPKEAA